jgi:hypothetical protein
MSDESEKNTYHPIPKKPDEPWYFAQDAKMPSSTYGVFSKHQAVSWSFPGYYLRKDDFGRAVIDICPSDREHLANPSIVSYERPHCRYLLENLVPQDVVGKKGTWEITIVFREET